MLLNLKRRLRQYRFVMEELVKRDFKKKYKRSFLGVLWSVVSPLLTLLVMRLVFTVFFARNIDHYTTYLFAGNLVFSYFRESTGAGMTSLMNNKQIISKVTVPKYLFVFSSNFSAFINFLATLLVFFLFAALDGITFHIRFLTLIYPVLCLLLFNIGVGLLLSALYVFFSDTQYLYNVFTLLLMYCSAIFYKVDTYGPELERLFLLNPIYVYIKFIRVVVIDGNLPSFSYAMLALGYAALFLGLGLLTYRKCNDRFLYYM